MRGAGEADFLKVRVLVTRALSMIVANFLQTVRQPDRIISLNRRFSTAVPHACRSERVGLSARHHVSDE
jgi:hypothetical protein